MKYNAKSNVESNLTQRNFNYHDKKEFKRDEVAQNFIPDRLKRDGYYLTALK